MKNEDINDELKMLIEDFTKILQYLIVKTIKNRYKTLENFKDTYNDTSNNNLRRFIKNFHFDAKILQSFARLNGKRFLDKILSNLDSTRLVYKHKCSLKFKKSGKIFSKPSTFYIPFKELERLFNIENVFKLTSEYYNQRQIKLIKKTILKYKQQDVRKSYTKSEKFYESIKTRKLNQLKNKETDDLTDFEIYYENK